MYNALGGIGNNPYLDIYCSDFWLMPWSADGTETCKIPISRSCQHIGQNAPISDLSDSLGLLQRVSTSIMIIGQRQPSTMSSISRVPMEFAGTIQTTIIMHG